MMIEVKVLVPEERIAEFHTWFGRWLGDDKPVTENAGPAGLGATENRDRADWTGADSDLAEWLWPKLASPAHRLFGVFIDRPGERFVTAEIFEAAGLAVETGYNLGGYWAWAGRYCKKVGRKLPIRYDEEGYWMEPEVAQIFKDVRDATGGAN